jgi:hypothetical protein
MVKVSLAGLMLAFGVTAHAGGSGCSSGTEFEPPLCPVHLPKIKSVAVEATAAKASSETDPSVDCSSFKLGERQVRRFLARAKRADANDAHHTLDWSPCHASGTISFQDGTTARWSIHQLRSGTLTFDRGDTLVLYCGGCGFRPFR